MKVRPTKRAAGLVGGGLALFVVATNVQAGWVFAAAALLAGIWALGLVLPFRALHGLEVARQAPHRVRAGDEATVSLRVRNTGRRPRMLVRVSDDFLGSGVAVVPMIGPGEERSYEGRRSGARRGVHRSGVATLESGAPFGVLVVRRPVDVATETIVYPRVFDLALDEILGRTAQPNKTTSGEISTVRDYRPGDPLRHVHWRSTAKRGELVVHEFEDHGRTELLVAADAPGDPDTADAVASVACSFALAALRSGRAVELASAGAGPGTPVPAAVAETVLDWGARIAPGRVALEHVLQGTDAPAVVCALEPSMRTRPAVEHLAHLARDGATVLAVLVGGDPQHAATLLRDAGAEVVQTRPEEVEGCFAISATAS